MINFHWGRRSLIVKDVCVSKDLEATAVALDSIQGLRQHTAPGSSIAIQIGEFTDFDCRFRR